MSSAGVPRSTAATLARTSRPPMALAASSTTARTSSRRAMSQGRRVAVVAASPDLALRVAPLLGRLGLVQSLQVSVHPLVERRVTLDRNASDSGRVEREVGRVDRPLRDRGQDFVDPPTAELRAGG